jgi:hypothetical protein
MVGETSETWFDAIAAVAAGIEGIATGAFGAGTTDLSSIQTDGSPAVQPMIDEELMIAPAAVLAYAGGPVTHSGQWQDQKHQLELSIWVDREPIAASYAMAIGFVAKVLAAFPQHAKAYSLHPALQHVLVMNLGAITPRAWPENSPRQFLVLPVSLEARVAHGVEMRPE